MEVIKDRRGDSVCIGDYVLFGIHSNSNRDIGVMQCEQVVDKNGYGIGLTNYGYRIKTPNRITKVTPDFASEFKMYTS
ncbi:hypothetical protein AVV36_gp291 [Pectobacterium bacteriophage PM2]|uniref:Uncharacterized protein n=1 Tax=Pectobacterium bacteriophage PM2 TaxID=1429794 RepID=A0A0A0PZI7_9CAUD|nr:hypothetical protein AVV36_gp291 [Pectobacterium bacteriophage PM2]AHY25119.1 hypothetical protein PM2_157 [Pectobacterium bacteriophage PM2]